jgi:hypothetical protein
VKLRFRQAEASVVQVKLLSSASVSKSVALVTVGPEFAFSDAYHAPPIWTTTQKVLPEIALPWNQEMVSISFVGVEDAVAVGQGEAGEGEAGRGDIGRAAVDAAEVDRAAGHAADARIGGLDTGGDGGEPVAETPTGGPDAEIARGGVVEGLAVDDALCGDGGGEGEEAEGEQLFEVGHGKWCVQK